MQIKSTTKALVGFMVFFVIAVKISPAQADFGDNCQSKQQQCSKQYYAHERTNMSLENQMRRIANYLEQYCQMNYHFPNSTDDRNFAKKQLMDLVPNNPFANDIEQVTTEAAYGSQYDQDAIGPGDPDRIQLEINYSLNMPMVRYWSRSTPEEWQAAPGTITCISNDKDMFIVWGAGADGRPILDDLTGRTAIIMGHWTGSADADTSTDASTDSIDD